MEKNIKPVGFCEKFSKPVRFCEKISKPVRFCEKILKPETGGITHRLGMKKLDRPRPIKLTMKSIDQKEQFMSKLGKLKFADDEFKKISVTNDYTIVEREEIRRWVKKANDKNDGMKDYVWKLRGTPKTGMRLVKIRNQQ